LVVSELSRVRAEAGHWAHRATVYTVRVRRKREADEFLPLGNIDGNGIDLAGLLAEYLGDLESSDAEETRIVQSSGVTRQGPELYVSVLHGQTGMVADIFGKTGDLRLHQTVDDTQKVRCGCLFRLPPADDMGFLATHINNGRAIKGLLDKGIQARFRQQFPDHLLAIKPFIEGSVFQEALAAGRLLKLKLIRVDRSDDRAAADLGKWIEGGAEAKEEFTLRPRAKGVPSGLNCPSASCVATGKRSRRSCSSTARYTRRREYRSSSLTAGRECSPSETRMPAIRSLRIFTTCSCRTGSRRMTAFGPS
jgi:hypothetical protein